MQRKHMTFSVSHVIKMEHRRRYLKLILLYFLNFIIAKSATLEFRPYDIIWNAPTIDCKSRFGVNVDPTPYGIRENDRNGLIGNVISLLYVDNTGLYPYYTSNGTAVNGGLPQVFLHYAYQLAMRVLFHVFIGGSKSYLISYRPQEKVMFSETSVSHSVKRGELGRPGGSAQPHCRPP